MEEAESAMVRLSHLVEQVLAKNEEMSLRLRNIDNAVAKKGQSTTLKHDGDASTPSIRTVTPPPGPFTDVTEGIQRKDAGFAFEEDLIASRVYRKPLFSESGESLVTSAARTTASSVLSALSLTDISNISILAVPVYAHEISNSARYTFGDFRPSVPAAESQQAPTKPAVWHQRLMKAIKPDPSPKPKQTILGTPLKDIIACANVAISLNTVESETIIYGYVPTFVAKIGVFLKAKGQTIQ